MADPVQGRNPASRRQRPPMRPASSSTKEKALGASEVIRMPAAGPAKRLMHSEIQVRRARGFS